MGASETMKPIRLSRHVVGQLASRGVSETEVAEAIQTADWSRAEPDRLECRKEFPFNREWNGTIYATKQVRPIFVEEEQEIVVVTVYAYYF